MGIVVRFSGDWDGSNLATLEQTLNEGMMEGMRQAVERLREIEAEYPEPGDYHLLGDNPPPFYSEKQKRFFFWALRNGVITVPYARTGALAAAWQESVESLGDAVVGHVWNDSPIAQLVMGEGEQAQMFQGVWETAQQRFHDAAEELVGILREHANQLMAEAFR